MPDPNHHPNCPRCNGEGFYLAYEGKGYMHDGSFSNNIWHDCRCYPDMPERLLPKPLEPIFTYVIIQHPEEKSRWMWGVLAKGKIVQKHKLLAIGLDGVDPWMT